MNPHPTLLEKFIRYEVDNHIRELILSAATSQEGPVIHTFEFNSFDLTLNIETGSATIRDMLDATATGVAEVPLAELVAAVQRSAGTDVR